MIAKRLEQLAAFYPQTALQENVQALRDFAGRQLEELGFVVTPLEYNGVHSLYAHPKGSKHSRLLLQAHIDVVPAENQPYKADGDVLKGRGVYDMLYATACYLELLHEIRAMVPGLDLGVMLSGDEEFGGFNGVKPFLGAGYTADVCLLPDAGEGFGSLNVAAKGVYGVNLRVHGSAHHGSRPWEGDGAAAKLVHFLARAEKLFDGSNKHNSTMTIARLQAGDAPNRGPATADCTLDIRYSDKTDLKRIQKELKRLCRQYDAEILAVEEGDDYKLDLDNTYVAEFLELYKRAAGKQISFHKAHGSSDARFFAAKDIPVIMCRPDGGGAHGDDEWISAAGIQQFYELLKAYVLQVAVVK